MPQSQHRAIVSQWSRCHARRRHRRFFFQAEDGIRDVAVPGVQTCALPIYVIERARSRFGLAVRPPAEVRLLDGYQGVGRAAVRKDELDTMLKLARVEGIVLDPVYTAKAFTGLLDTLRRDPRALGRRVCFVHTGGVFSVFPYRAALSRLVDGDGLVES